MYICGACTTNEDLQTFVAILIKRVDAVVANVAGHFPQIGYIGSPFHTNLVYVGYWI